MIGWPYSDGLIARYQRMHQSQRNGGLLVLLRCMKRRVAIGQRAWEASEPLHSIFGDVAKSRF